MKKTKSLSLAVAAAAMAFTFSCSGDDGGGGGDSSSSDGGLGEVSSSSEATPSSSSDAPSSSSDEPSSSSEEASSSSDAPSSSSDEPSSSSEEASSSSDAPSSSSDEPSSSSEEASSSSDAPSSSSDEPSSSSGGYTGSYGSIMHGGQTYKTVVIGTQTWMAENLNYNASGSKCFGEGGQVIIDWDEDDNRITATLSPSEVQANCEKYGRLYDWQTAQTVCPSGWHLPTNDDWDKLFKYVDAQNGGEGEGTPYESRAAGKYLKATSGWNWNDEDNISGNGTDKYGFSALPGGGGLSDGSFDGAGFSGLWWSASESNSGYAYSRIMYYDYEHAYWSDLIKSYLLSVRCVQD